MSILDSHLSLPSFHGNFSADGIENFNDFVEVAVNGVLEKLAAVWPLKDYVAVNPYIGFSDEKFLDARSTLKTVSDFETLMSGSYFKARYEAGVFDRSDIDTAIDELVADKVTSSESLTSPDVIRYLESVGSSDEPVDQQRLTTTVEQIDAATGSDWSSIVCEEVSKTCAAYYDEGQAAWSNPLKGGSLFEAWRATAAHDYTMSIHGIAGFQSLVNSLPPTPNTAVAALLTQLKVPVKQTSAFLLCHALKTIGWSSWTKFQSQSADIAGEPCDDFVSLLAIRLAYECAIAEQLNFTTDWHVAFAEENGSELIRYVLLRATEVAYRKSLLADIAGSERTKSSTTRKLAQLVFCIDVRSERYRRHLEATSSKLETFGFAGFFGMPIEYVSLGESTGSRQVPALIAPHFQVHETIGEADESVVAKRSAIRGFRKAWKEFQSSVTSCFAFVETSAYSMAGNC